MSPMPVMFASTHVLTDRPMLFKDTGTTLFAASLVNEARSAAVMTCTATSLWTARLCVAMSFNQAM